MPDSSRISRASFLLAGGRVPGLLVAFAIPLVLARVFDQTEFGTYKQLFLIYATVFGLAQAGMAESLYYFVPSNQSTAGRFIANAMIVLAGIGLLSVLVLTLARERIADWLTNPALAPNLPLLGWFLALMLTSAVFEIVLLSKKRSGTAATAYAISDIARAACLTIPAALAWGLRGVMIGAVAFAAVRVIATIAVMAKGFGTRLRPDGAVLRTQLAYAMPFALAVGIEVLHINWHQYAVAARFDAAAFAIYAVGCLQVPVVDLIVTSACNVMMVEMAAAQQSNDLATARWLWHDTIGRLAFMILPLAVFLIMMAHPIIVLLFTSTYEASVPIFMLWSLTMLASVLVVDGVLRVFAQTRYLLIQNILHLAIVASLAGTFLTFFGLQGAVLVTLFATLTVRSVAVVRICRLMRIPLIEALPWRSIGSAAALAVIAAAPVLAVNRLALPPLVAIPLAGAAYALVYGALVFAVHRRGPLSAISVTA